MKHSKIIIVIAVALALFLTDHSEPEAHAEPNTSFYDLPTVHWGYDAISWAVSTGIMDGYPDRTIRADDPVKGNEWLAMLLRYYQEQESNGSMQWDDPYFQKAITLNWPVHADKPRSALIKRGEVAQVLAASLGHNFDIDNSVQFLYYADLSNGKRDQTIEGFSKNSLLTRAEAVTFIYNLHSKEILSAKPRPVFPSKPLINYPASSMVYEGDHLGLITVDGEVLIPDAEGRVKTKLSEGLVAVQDSSTGKIGYMNEWGELVIPYQFKEGHEFSEGLACVKWTNPKDELQVEMGYINKQGKVILNVTSLLQFNPDYAACSPFQESLALLDGVQGSTFKTGYIDTQGHWAISPQFDSAFLFSYDRAAVVNRSQGDELYGFVDRSGKIAISYQYQHANDFYEGLAAVRYGDYYGFIDPFGKVVIPFTLEGVPTGRFSEGLAAVNAMTPEGLKVGYIDYYGNWVIEPIYDGGADFSRGLADVLVGDKRGFIDRQGNWIIEPEYSYMGLGFGFQDTLARVLQTMDGQDYILYINKENKPVHKIQIR